MAVHAVAGGKGVPVNYIIFALGGVKGEWFLTEVEFYIKQFPPEVQRRLFYIRAIGFDVFYNAEERIYHRVPTFMFNGKDILNYGAYKDHITLWLGYSMIDYLKNAYPQFHYTKVTMQIPHLDCFPNELIRETFEILRTWHW